MPAEISKKSTNWNCDNIISELLILHKKWSNIRHESDFDYRFIRRENASLCSAIDSKKHFESLTESYKAAGISPNCHIKIRSYGENEYERKNKFIAVIKEFVIIYGVNALNDNSINSDDLIELPRALRMGGHFGACVSARCAENLISKRSIYAQGRRLFGSWKSAVEASGISYDAEVLRKVSSRERAEYIEKFANFISKNKTNLSIKVLREKNQPIYKGLHNSHKHSPLVGAVEDFMLAALIEAEHFLCNTKEPVEEYFKKKLQ